MVIHCSDSLRIVSADNLEAQSLFMVMQSLEGFPINFSMSLSLFVAFQVHCVNIKVSLTPNGTQSLIPVSFWHSAMCFSAVLIE